MIVVFLIDERRCALPLSYVERVVPMVEITLLPSAPDIVIGIINVGGQIIPVVNMRQRFAYPEKALTLDNNLIIAYALQRKIALVVDDVIGVMEVSEEDKYEADKIMPGLEHVKGVIKSKDGLILIHDLDTFLTFGEEALLDKAMSTIKMELKL